MAALLLAVQFLHNAEEISRRLGIQFLSLFDKFLQSLRIRISFIEEFLRRYAQIFANEEEGLHGRKGLVVFDVIDVIVCLSQ